MPLAESGGRLRLAMALGMSFVVAVALSACGGSGGSAISPQGVRVVRAAYTTTLKQKTAKFSLTEVVRASSSAGSAEAARVTGGGEAGFLSHDVETTLNSPSGGALGVRQLGAMTYIHVPPAQRSQVPGHKPWVVVDLNKVAQAKLGRSFSQLTAANNDSPSQVLSHLSQVSDHITKAGKDRIRGVQTTEYKAQVDLNKLAAQTKRKSGAKAAQAIRQQAQALGTHTLPISVWIGPHNLVRQITQRAPIPAASAGATNGTGSATLTIDFFDYGTPVRITPPPSGQVANITSQIVQQAKATSG